MAKKSISLSIEEETIEKMRIKYGGKLSKITEDHWNNMLAGSVVLRAEQKTITGKEAYALETMGKILAWQKKNEGWIIILIDEVKKLKRKLGLDPRLGEITKEEPSPYFDSPRANQLGNQGGPASLGAIPEQKKSGFK